MADALEELKREAKALGSAPMLVGLTIVLLIVLIWGLLHWSYRSVIAGKNNHIASLERRVAAYRNSVNGASPEEADGGSKPWNWS